MLEILLAIDEQFCTEPSKKYKLVYHQFYFLSSMHIIFLQVSLFLI
jgi:hypothetical protein